MSIRKIEIEFPMMVEIPPTIHQRLCNLVQAICKANEPGDMTMWHSSEGSKITYMPMTIEEEKHRPVEFDDSILHLGCSIRRRYKSDRSRLVKCQKCQGIGLTHGSLCPTCGGWGALGVKMGEPDKNTK